ncbi:hypothetical protein GF312_05210, partial [Candidatus Poribacteria bacterium]|nr:hypothetical protein [Candidatus Poribacteria bacterium]
MQSKENEGYLDYIKSEKDFERFCNIFLKTEISRLVKVYSASGRDKGTDAEYSGAYEYKGNYENGYWIFQYKYSDPTMDNMKKRRNFLNTVIGTKRKKGEIDKAYELGCDYYVLLTNISLTKGNYDKLQKAKEEKGYKFNLFCWDQADLNSMVEKFPYIMTSFLPIDRKVFFSWDELFKSQIKGKHKLLRYDYKTIGREKEMEELWSFINDANSRIMILYGTGGIGKTKLSIDLAKRIEQEKEIEPLFIRESVQNFEDSFYYIPPNKDYLFFIDNAHEFYGHFGSLAAILDDKNYQNSKVILITREPFKKFIEDNFIYRFPSQAIRELRLSSLSRDKTKELISKYSVINNESILSSLARIARDTPLIAVMIIDYYSQKKDLKELTGDKLIDHVFESYIRDIFNTKLTIRNTKHRDMLNWLSGIEPIEEDNEYIINQLAEVLNIKKYEVNKVLSDLIDYGFVVKRSKKLRIFPDQLSDYILRSECLHGFHDELLNKFLRFAPDNVIKNLAKIESMIDQKTLLDIFVSEIKRNVLEGNNSIRYNILLSIEGLCYYRSSDAIDIFNMIINNPKTEESIIDSSLLGQRTIAHKDLIRKIIEEARKTTFTLEGFVETIDIIQKLLPNNRKSIYPEPAIELLKDMISFKTSKSLTFQFKALDKFDIWANIDDPRLSIPMLEAVKSLFILEISETIFESGKINISWHILKYTPQVAELRKRAIDLLRKSINSNHIEVKKKVIECIKEAMHPLRMRPDIDISHIEKLLISDQKRLFNIIEEL